MTLGDRIRRHRQKAGPSQEAVAELVGVSRQAVTKWETGQSTPSTENLFRLAEVFGTTVDLLIAEENAPSSVAREMYRLMKEEEAEKAAQLRRRKRKDLAFTLLSAAGYLLLYLLGRLLWCTDHDISFMGFLLYAAPKGPHSYLYGWLLSSRLFWYAMLLSVLPSLRGKHRFSLTALGGFALAMVFGICLGPTIYGTGEYGWAYWGGVFLVSLLMGTVLQKMGTRGIPLRSRPTLLWLALYTAALLLMLLLVRMAIPSWQGIPG